MANQLFIDRLNAVIEACLVEAAQCAGLEHQGLTGAVRQLVVERLLQPLLPDGFMLGTGKITDAHGNLSAETDVIIYDRRSISPLMYDSKLGVFPIESVHYAIEVKSTLTEQELKNTIKKGQKLRSLIGQQPHSALFAFSTNLTNTSEIDRFIEQQKDMPSPLPVNLYCVAGRQYAFVDLGSWGIWDRPEKHSEISGFLVGIANTLSEAVHVKPRPAPGLYFFERI